MKDSVTLVTLVTLLALTSTCFAQEDILRPYSKRPVAVRDSTVPDMVHSRKVFVPSVRLGIEAGMNYNIYTRAISGSYLSSPTTVYAQGSGFSPFGALVAELTFAPRFGIGVRFLYETKNFENTVTEVTSEAGIVDPSTGYVVTYKTIGMDATFASTSSVVTIAPYVRWSPFLRFMLQLGPVIQFASTAMATSTTQTIDNTETFRFYNGITFSKSVTVYDEEEITPSTRYGLDLGLGYSIPVSSWCDIVPRISYQWMFSPYTGQVTRYDASKDYSSGSVPYTAAEATLHGLQVSVALMFVL